MDSLFTQDVVRDFMLSKGGKVKNHDLVAHFRPALNDPRNRDENRKKFKAFVNTLSTVKLDETGEKVLVLKKKFRLEETSKSPSSSPATKQSSRQPKKLRKEKAMPKPYGADDGDTSGDMSQNLSASVASIDSSETASPAAASTSREEMQSSPPPDSGASLLSEIHSHMTELVDRAHDDDVQMTDAKDEDPANSSVNQSSNDSVFEAAFESSSQNANPVETPSVPVIQQVEEASSPPQTQEDAVSLTPTTPADQIIPQEAEKQGSVPMSVRERAKHLNKINSESDLSRSQPKRSQKGNDEEESALETITLSTAEREWVLTVCKADYQDIHKILLNNPQFAKRKDFITTPLHWAAKHGQPEVVKLLCGTHNASVNARSGYTPLHLASMHGREGVIELLVQVYGADANLRDYSGKKAKQYLRNSASSRSQLPVSVAPLQRKGSYSSKIRTAGHFGIPTNTAMRTSWAAGTHDDRSISPSASPLPSPGASPAFLRKGSADDVTAMPPPKKLPLIRKRKSQRGKENFSDSEMPGSDSDSGMASSSSYPNIVQKSSYV